MLKQNIYTNTLGLARSLMAFSLLITLVFNSDKTLFPVEYLRNLNANDWLIQSNIFYIFSENLIVAKIIAITILLFTISGFCPKISGILHWWMTSNFFNAAYILEGGDQIMAITTLLLVPITFFDPRKNHWDKKIPTKKTPLTIGNIFLIIIYIQVSVMYFQAAFVKILNVSEWANGTALFYYLNHPVYGASDSILHYINFIFGNPLFLSTSTWMVLLLEFILGTSIFFSQKIKRKLFFIAIFFHFSIAILLGLGSFFIAMSGVLVLYLLEVSHDLKFLLRNSDECHA